MSVKAMCGRQLLRYNKHVLKCQTVCFIENPLYIQLLEKRRSSGKRENRDVFFVEWDKLEQIALNFAVNFMEEICSF